jgi:hypothetical protein
MSSLLQLTAVAGVLILSACTPKFDWREVRGSDAPFVVLMPAKPLTLSRSVNLAGTPITMTMTAAEIDGVSFAVGSAELPDPAQAQAALSAMQTALVKNINGAIRHQKSSAVAQSSGTAASQTKAIEIEARSEPVAASGGQAWLLLARFIAQDRRVYQAVVLGRANAVSRDAADIFLTSFKLN